MPRRPEDLSTQRKQKKGGGVRKPRKRDEWEGWTTSVWDVRKPGEAPAEQKKSSQRGRAPRPQRNAQGGARVAGNFGYGGNTRSEIRALQNALTTAARDVGYTSDMPIPGLGGLTLRNLSRRQFPALEAEMRAALSALRARRATR